MLDDLAQMDVDVQRPIRHTTLLGSRFTDFTEDVCGPVLAFCMIDSDGYTDLRSAPLSWKISSAAALPPEAGPFCPGKIQLHFHRMSWFAFRNPCQSNYVSVYRVACI